MKKIGIVVFIVAVMIGVVFANFLSFGKVETSFFNGFSFKRGVKGSGNLVSEARQLPAFNGIKVGGVFEVEYTPGPEHGVQIEADDNLLPLISTEVRDGMLVIRTEKSIKSSRRIAVKVTAPNIERIDAGGVAKVLAMSINNAKLTIDISGASKVSVGGETTDLTVDVSGASKTDAEQLRAVNANVDSSGASKVVVNVTGQLKADASGASRITYVGSPANVDKRSSGAGKVSPKD